MKKAPTRLTEGFINKLKYEGKVTVVRDTKVIGLMVAIHKNTKSYKVQRDLWTGSRGRRRLVKTVRYTIGTNEEMSLDAARDEALIVIGKIKRGIDPNKPPEDTCAEGWTVEHMYNEYVDDLETRDSSWRTMANMLARLERYLPKWKTIPIGQIKRSMVRDEHKRITKNHGPYVANQCMRDFRACYNFSLKVIDDPDSLPANPIIAVTFNKERASNRVIMPDELPEWWQKINELGNPLRRDMHILGLLSALRPGTLVSIQKEWINLEAKSISIPRMKSGRSFDLPLSDYMVKLVKNIIAQGEVLYPGSEWLFPARSRIQKKIIATQVWKEKTLPSQTGHILRHTYRTIAQRVGVDKIDAMLLLDHTVQGINGVYIHEKALFDRLLATQETMTESILELCQTKDN